MDAMLTERLGNLHLAILHLPIGFVFAAVLLELWLWRRPSTEGRWLAARLLAATAVVTLLAAATGLVLAGNAGGHDADTLSWHRWLGVGCAALAITAWAARARGADGWARAVLAALALAVIAAGHAGATLTHGPAVTAWWRVVEPAPVTETVRATLPATETPAAPGVFENEIQPLLASSCVDCHGAKRARGGLRLDSREAALAGGKSGLPAIVPGAPERSELLRRVRLPAGHDDVMPAGKDARLLTAAEIAALEQWIADGAEWP